MIVSNILDIMILKLMKMINNIMMIMIEYFGDFGNEHGSTLTMNRMEHNGMMQLSIDNGMLMVL